MADINDIHKAFCDSTGISTDSRNCQGDAMFVALKGDNFDGNEYIEEVLSKGAKYAITSNRKLAHLKNVFIVDNTLKTLQELAQFHRKQLSFPIISITGTNGKTTTKELINAVLSEKFKIKATKGNFNNHIGVPLTLLSFTKEMEMGIVEMGANHIGEIELLCSIAEPDFCIITNVGKAHLEGFGSFDGVKKAKGEMYAYAAKNDKLIFINKANTHLQEMASQNKLRYEFGLKTDIEVQLKDAAPFVKVAWTDKQLKKEFITSTNLIGAYNLENINAAIAIGRYFNVSPDAINHAISSYQPTNNRSQFINSENNRIIMDAYNANPSSMAVALDNFNQIHENKKWIILGGMKELGNDSHSEHKKLIKTIDDCEFSKVLLIGDEFSGINGSYNHFSNNSDCINYIKQNSPKEAYILIKGSRSNRLEELLPYL